MTLRSAIDAWNRFFFAPQSPLSLCLFRIVFGAVIVINLLLLYPDWLAWYGPRAWTSLATMRLMEPGVRLNLFTVIPQSNAWIEGLFWTFLASAVMLAFGFLSRINAVFVFLCLTSLDQRNLYMLHGGDTFLRVAAFFLMFAPSGAALSIDRWSRFRRAKHRPEIQPKPPWAQRMIQFELSLMYFMTFWSKSTGAAWVNGSALYYVLHLDEMRRFPMPHWLQQPVFIRLQTWFTLALEFSLGTLIWFKELRYPLLLLGLLFHLTIEYSMNTPMFQWDVLSAYILFIDPDDLARIGRHATERVRTLLRLQPVS